ncbi:MAG TPA: PrpR N-terminal domain-containing protein, partial [Tissierellaceae bacterium]|nr:PrpR N-terminal domain-containing protein [Tissierellaceae bacterium]
MKRIKALGIAPYEGVKEIMDKIALEKSELDLTTYTANLEDAIDIIKNSKENYEVIISRGGTAKLLEDYVDIPIVEISFTVYDILRSIDEAKRYTNSYSILGYHNL